MRSADELMSVPEVARLAEVSEREVREAIRQDVLEAQKVGASWAIRREDAEEWSEELDAEAEPEPGEIETVDDDGGEDDGPEEDEE